MQKAIVKQFASINLQEYRYHLPDEKIAKYPLEKRDESKLLVYQQGKIQHKQFKNIVAELPSDSLLVFNNTKVIPARLHFRKHTGAVIEIFLLNPVEPSPVISEAMEQKGWCVWKCMIGNLKRWKNDQVLEQQFSINETTAEVRASIIDRNEGLIKFEWSNPNLRFVDIVEASGEVPLPPYMNRKAEEGDKPRYQTVYSKEEGAVAAPTAGLHFTEDVLQQLSSKNIKQEYLTLHVSAGTFRPIKEGKVEDHPMHCEQIQISIENIRHLIANLGSIIAVGTTSMRTIESLYWYGVKLLKNPSAPFFVSKDEAYLQDEDSLPSSKEAFDAILKRMETDKKDKLFGETEIFIVPGYNFKVCRGLITNFHQPESTLILLVASFIGPDWKKIYDTALTEGYRFLSYGDSSLLLP